MEDEAVIYSEDRPTRGCEGRGGEGYGDYFWVIVVRVLPVCVEVLRPRQPNGVMSGAVSLSNHTFTGQA